ncbi:probable proline--tRNA ligase, mitochondrial [Anopheles marshallii]|uniref:probable proline--tRNA ligase, mitochondrial n=1 Tax=Anopheles marshallii TaxID=1521116 RepID=UPI00237C039C|nr:probable proline--tRNA ligase, mitochondrial [Anopheles marshallii]
MQRISKLFQPALITPKNATIKSQDITSKSQRLMLEQGLIRQAGNGTFYLLPLLQRCLQKAINLVDRHMEEIGAQKLTLPLLTSAELWRKSGRLGSSDNGTPTELLQTTDRHGKVQILGPTHEESITSLLAAIAPVTYRQFPLRLYQISTKFRDEMKPRFGLMRAKEFLMKDLYTFDVDRAHCRETYEEVNEVYGRLFSEIGVPFVKVAGDSGTMGGSVSHEYHFPSELGEDQLIQCTRCGMHSNAELFPTLAQRCKSCNGSETLEQQPGIEVAHAFILEDRYTKTLGATCLQPNGKPMPLQMGCYGIGVTRLIAASIEVLSNEKEIRWPALLAPYHVCIITPKAGSKEESQASPLIGKLYNDLQMMKHCKGEVIVDDRTQLTIGKRLLDARKMGYPIIVIVGSKAMHEEILEVHNLTTAEELNLSYGETLTTIGATLSPASKKQIGRTQNHDNKVAQEL